MLAAVVVVMDILAIYIFSLQQRSMVTHNVTVGLDKHTAVILARLFRVSLFLLVILLALVME